MSNNCHATALRNKLAHLADNRLRDTCGPDNTSRTTAQSVCETVKAAQRAKETSTHFFAYAATIVLYIPFPEGNGLPIPQCQLHPLSVQICSCVNALGAVKILRKSGQAITLIPIFSRQR